MDISKIREQVGKFLDELPPNAITVGLLRFGAHLPHIARRRQRRRTRLILSHMIEFFARGELAACDYVLLDDTMYRGDSMERGLARLISAGVPRERIKTAAVVVHDRCKRTVDFKMATLAHQEYVEWKEELTAVVRNDVRPTERDHPLYYFEVENFHLGEFLSNLNVVGRIQPAHVDGSQDLLRLTVTVDPVIIDDLRELPGLNIAEPLKVKIHCLTDAKRHTARLTFVPITPAIVNVPLFLAEKGARKLTDLLVLRHDFFQAAQSHAANAGNAAAYYFINRGMAAVFFQRFLGRLLSTTYPIALRPMEAEKVDMPVEYLFPAPYETFHAAIHKRLAELCIADRSFDNPQPPLFVDAAMDDPVNRNLPTDVILPQSTLILEFLDSRSRAAEFRDGGWQPSLAPPVGVTHHDLLDRFKNSEFIAAAVDDLLDYGLLRAVDTPLSNDGTMFGRWFLPGGEYKSIEVTRIADAWRNIEPDIEAECEEEAVELWGSYAPGIVTTR